VGDELADERDVDQERARRLVELRERNDASGELVIS
jgi:hypothetical protein